MPSALTNTTLTELIKKLLKVVDNYNANDLTISTESTDQNTSGEMARICINLALHEMYDMVKDSRYLESYPTTTLLSTANQDYIELDVEASLDEIDSLVDMTNQFRLIQKSWDWYKTYAPDPSQVTGTPQFYINRADRVYLTPRPTDIIQYSASFVKFEGDLVLGGDVSLFPTQYDYWIIAEAKVHWAKMQDPTNVPQAYILDRESARDTAISAINSSFDYSPQMSSNFGSRRRRGAWDRVE